MCADNYLNIIPVLWRKIGIRKNRDSRFSARLINNVLSKAPGVFWVADGTLTRDVNVGSRRSRGEELQGECRENRRTSIRASCKRRPVATQVDGFGGGCIIEYMASREFTS